jgi:hypothetical protein
MTNKKRDVLADKIRREVPMLRLVAAMAFIMAHRRERAGINVDELLSMAEADHRLDAFMKTSNIRQLKMLREIALDLKEEKVLPEALSPKAKFTLGLGFESKKKH